MSKKLTRAEKEAIKKGEILTPPLSDNRKHPGDPLKATDKNPLGSSKHVFCFKIYS